MLTALASPVCALIPASESERDGFDETGSLRIDHWHDMPLPIAEERLRFVEGPAEEVNTLIEQIAALSGEFAPESITIGIGDVSGAEALARRLAVAGLPTASPFGRPLGRVGPGALLGLVRDYLHDNASVRRFAALIRHPDLEQWLTESEPNSDRQSWPAAAQTMAGAPLIHCLDFYRTECLVEHLPQTDEKTPTTALEAARLRVLTARDRIEALIAALRGGPRALSDWVGPISRVLEIVLGDARQSRRGLAGIAGLLQEMRQIRAPLAPPMTGTEALAFVCAEAEAIFLPTDPDGPTMAMRGWLDLALDDAPVLLLTGLHEGSIPAGAGDDSLMPDSLRRRWGLADDRRRRARDAWLLRVMLESRPQVQIVVTRRGADGSPQMPSRLLFACDGLTAARRALAYTRPTERVGPTPPLFTPGGARRLPPPRPESLQSEINSLKVTAFRDYLACPYRFFLRYLARLEETSDDADEMDPRAFGNLLHPCLETFARSSVADSTDPARIAAFLRDELERQCRRRFGAQMPAPVWFQVRQAGKRLDAFAHWQAQSARDGWQVQNDLAEREMEAALIVDERPFVIRGRLDRVDYHPATDRFRIIDYKTSDSGTAPEEKHRKTAEGGGRVWTDLQLPLYRTLLAAQGFSEEAIEVGYILLAADLNPANVSTGGRTSGGSGFVGVRWGEEEYRSAHECAAEVVRNIRAGVFWPPSEPPRFTDAFSGLCMDSCGDREDWFAGVEESGQ
jgi:ATP-dependent helicase/nuclease subunit B